jgi:hypothetical protein
MYGDKEFEPEEIERELWRVCQLVWRYTPDDVDDEALPLDVQAWLDEIYEQDDSGAALNFALRHGYDLTDQGQPLTDWWWFTLMILGEKHGIMTPEHIAAARLKSEADKFQEDKRAGVIRGD